MMTKIGIALIALISSSAATATEEDIIPPFNFPVKPPWWPGTPQTNDPDPELPQDEIPDMFNFLQTSLRGSIMGRLRNEKKPNVISQCNGDYTVDMSSYPAWGSISGTPTLGGWDQCETLVGSLTVKGCPNAGGCRGSFPLQFYYLTKITGDYVIQYNQNSDNTVGPSTLNWLPPNLATVTGQVNVLCNYYITKLDGFNNLTSAGGIDISQNSLLETLDGMGPAGGGLTAGTLTINRNNLVSSWGSLGYIARITGLYIDLASTNSFPSISPLKGNSIVWGQVYRVSASDTSSVMNSICQKTVAAHSGGYTCGTKGSGWAEKNPLNCN